MSKISRASFLGVQIAVATRQEVLEELLTLAEGKNKSSAFYLNAHCVNIASRDKEYRRILNRSSLVYVGGQGVIWAAGFLGLPIRERANIIDFLEFLIPMLKDKQISIYLLGGDSRTAQKARLALEEKGMKIVWARSGYFDAAEEAAIIREINLLKPNILMVGMGVPKQEKWIFEHADELEVNLCWGVGGFLKIASGEIKRPAAWVSRLGLEWLYLGFCEPKRFFTRYLLGNPLFICRVMAYKLKAKC